MPELAGGSRRGDLDKRIMHQLQVPAHGRRKRARPLGTGQKDPEFEKLRGASARLVQVRSSEHVRKDEIQRPQDDADLRMLGYPFDWRACSQSRYCEIPQMLNPRRTGFERLPLFMWPRIWASRCCMHERSQLRSDRLGGTLAGFRRCQSPHATIWIVRGAGIGDHRTEWTSADR